MKRSFVLTASFSFTKTILLTAFKKTILGAALTYEKFAGAKIVASPGNNLTAYSKWTQTAQCIAISGVECVKREKIRRTKERNKA